MRLEGALGAALVGWQSGRAPGATGGGVSLDVAVVGNAAVGLDDKLEDTLITPITQYRLIRVLERDESLFLYGVLSK